MQPRQGILFRQQRVGQYGKLFTLYKLRTMHNGSEDQWHALASTNGLDTFGHIADDPRVTPFGRWLRTYWIDELPSLWNLVCGDIGLVGPRPTLPDSYASLPSAHRALRAQVPPGLMGCTYADYFDIRTYDDHLASEQRYIEKKLAAPFRTDVTYFCKIVMNILRGARGA